MRESDNVGVKARRQFFLFMVYDVLLHGLYRNIREGLSSHTHTKHTLPSTHATRLFVFPSPTSPLPLSYQPSFILPLSYCRLSRGIQSLLFTIRLSCSLYSMGLYWLHILNSILLLKGSRFVYLFVYVPFVLVCCKVGFFVQPTFLPPESNLRGKKQAFITHLALSLLFDF